MTDHQEARLKAWNDAIDAERIANSMVAAAASHFLSGKIDRAELARYSEKAASASRASDATFAAYKASYTP
jgi:hypothetical protein